MRTVIAAVLFMIAGAAVLVSYALLDILLSGTGDSTDSYYIGGAATMLLIAGTAVFAGTVALRRR